MSKNYKRDTVSKVSTIHECFPTHKHLPHFPAPHLPHTLSEGEVSTSTEYAETVEAAAL